MPVRHFVTAKELEEMGERDFDSELVRGQLVPMTPRGGEHGALGSFLNFELSAFVRARGLGRVYLADTGFILRRDPDTVRAPDIGFVSRECVGGLQLPRGFVPGPPDLAVEVRSPNDTLAELFRKAAEYLDAGTRLVWIVEPRSRRVYVFRPGEKMVTLSGKATLDGGDVLPGFTLSLSRLFAELD